MANGTTLGADNGIGVAQILNLLDEDIIQINIINTIATIIPIIITAAIISNTNSIITYEYHSIFITCVLIILYYY